MNESDPTLDLLACESTDAARKELRQAIADCKERRLIESVKWAAQQLAGLPPPQGESSCKQRSSVWEDVMMPKANSEEEEDRYQLAISLFDLRVCLFIYH